MGTLLRGRHFITTQDFTKEEIDLMLETSFDLKRRFARDELTPWLLYKTVFMIFYDESTRTRNSIEAGITQLGGHAHYLVPEMMQAHHGETPADTAKVLSRFGHAIAVRHCAFGQGNKFLRDLAANSNVPVLNLQDDVYHPMQVLADLMTIQERFGKNLKGLKVGISWAYAESHLKPLSVPQSQILLFARYGMDITLAYPEGFDLMPDIVKQAKLNAEAGEGKLTITHNMDEAFKDADVVIPKSWGGFYTIPNPLEADKYKDKIWAEAAKHKDWICDERRMSLTKKHSVYMHALPADRGKEVVDSVIDGPHSIVWDEAENRLHTAKAVMALTMGGRP
ncbi:ornithine carbamoyltransferase [Athalassotoga saccharophila]|uniref:ornithine carbamoyltransferase n=1 Tax=Athalassotoga saccharophila TaxID=1441386 RepID=UPI001379EF5A|nr:ornithine carbamoyltransferase [Athalassotoga saccharophila]BBJ28824.1 putative carbamoyltransferase YgeW [Athalassotoga saccharophila]